jgi:aminopeptidase N
MPRLQIKSYEVAIDLTGAGTFLSRTEIRFRGDPGATVTADMHALDVRQAILNGAELSAAASSGGLRLDQLARDNTLIVDAEFAYARPGGIGLVRETRPGDITWVYSKANRGGAAHIFCCFDQPDLRAPFTVSIRAPAGWPCLANAPSAAKKHDQAVTQWTFAATRPIAPYLVGICAGLSAGPVFACTRHDGSPLRVTAHAVPPAVERLDAVLDAEMFQQPLLYYERELNLRYPDDKCDVAFLPQFAPALAFGAPGLLTTQEEILNLTGKPAAYLPGVMAHELAHAWFGDTIEFLPAENAWLEEAVTTYISRSALEARYPDVNPWSTDISPNLPDHAYATDAAPLKQLETMIGKQAIMSGLSDLIRDHADQTVTKDDLAHTWSLASGQDLREWIANQLVPGTA